jgi:light-harvesting complex 1 beta chain
MVSHRRQPSVRKASARARQGGGGGERQRCEEELAMAEGGTALNHTGLTEPEAKEIHAYFIKGFQIWAAVSLIAHALTYQWLPWFPG